MTTTQRAELLKRLQKLDHDFRTRHYPSVWTDSEAELEPPQERDAEQWFQEQQCPADSNFR